MTSHNSKITEDQIYKGQAVYSKRVLNIYDIAVLGVSNRYIWKCTTPILLDWFNQHVSSNHLELGVGTGYFPDHCHFPSKTPHLKLVDLNQGALGYASERLRRYRPKTQVHDLLKPFDKHSETFDSISLNYVLHCLPGNLQTKAIVFDHILPLLNTNGTVFGSTILQGGVKRNLAASCLMGIYNRKGIFNNTQDDLDTLHNELNARFASVDIRVTGCVARFSAKGY
ncbi:methyltransferase type 12 [Endozoicomonas montiporae]|uniref:Methyltransferase type 12 n=2 Tax=Endozoicomonas montiporae TaxID=1027273 RepID=A0A081N2D1_9GAMM|nr:class I SAM-dependent methyltransferase [Endozoicomonas montiporae]AMO58433.1 type 12 methyltransferase [Endozoicomonas montiporae CL-33]KEQ12604.1 methyltransferase type 12 [Endozoicomonas montiporae]